MGKDRKRNFYWQTGELTILSDCYKKYAGTLNSKCTKNVTNEMKNKVYAKIKQKLDANFPEYCRLVDDIKVKVKGLKCEARAIENQENYEVAQTGGGRKSSTKSSNIHEQIINFNKGAPSFNGGIPSGIESDVVLSQSATPVIISTPSPLFGIVPSTSRRSPRISQSDSLNRKQLRPVHPCSPKKLKISVGKQQSVKETKPSASSTGQSDYGNQLRIGVLELEKERLQLEIEKVRFDMEIGQHKNELLIVKKKYYERKLEQFVDFDDEN